MSAGLDSLKHIVVLMMENRSFDHMLGSLKAQDPRINGLAGTETNLDTTNEPVKVQPLAAFQGQLDPDPDHHFPAVNKQLFFGTNGPPGVPAMQGFVQSYYDQEPNVGQSQKIMYYFTPDKLPVLTTLARSFALFNGWFASIPGPTICNRAFAHYGTSFGSVSMDPFVVKAPYLSMYDRMLGAGLTTKLYYFDEASSTMEVVNLLSNQPQIFATYDQFLADCQSGDLPQYSFIERDPSKRRSVGEHGSADRLRRTRRHFRPCPAAFSTSGRPIPGDGRRHRHRGAVPVRQVRGPGSGDSGFTMGRARDGGAGSRGSGKRPRF
jgi:phospholipase C